MTLREIISFRKESKLTQTQIADFLDIDQTTIAKVEKGTRKMRADWLELLEELFVNGAIRCDKPKLITGADLKQIADVNRIILNVRFMQKKELEV